MMAEGISLIGRDLFGYATNLHWDAFQNSDVMIPTARAPLPLSQLRTYSDSTAILCRLPSSLLSQPSTIGSRFLQFLDAVPFENYVPHSSFVMLSTLQVSTLFTTISIEAIRSACSLLQCLENKSYEELPFLRSSIYTCRQTLPVGRLTIWEPRSTRVSSTQISFLFWNPVENTPQPNATFVFLNKSLLQLPTAKYVLIRAFPSQWGSASLMNGWEPGFHELKRQQTT